ncbi:putative PHD type zinc finger protein with BAH domain-containing protein, partial [Coemansia guatemalensis]
NRGLWPFRYFGINTNIDDVLHDDERIYPRAVSRIGPKYQAIIPDMVSPSGPELDRQLMAENAKMLGAKDRKPNGKIAHARDKALNLQGTTNGRASNGQFSMGHSYNGNRTGRETNGTGLSPVTGAGGGGGGGGTTRWHGKNAEQMDRTWDEIEMRRGNHDALLFFRQPKFLSDDELDMYMEAIVPFLQRHMETIRDFTLLDCQDAALHGLALHKYDVEEALISIPDCPEGYVRQRSPGDYWTPETMLRFNDYLREFGSNLQAIHESLPAITRRAITLHYYLVRHSRLGEQLLEAYDNRNHGGQRRTNLGQGESAVNVHPEVASDAVPSGVNTPASSPRSRPDENERSLLRCANCARERATRWHPAPPELAFHNTRSAKASATQRVVCGACRTHWLHYGVMPDGDAAAARKNHQQYAQTSAGSVGSN